MPGAGGATIASVTMGPIMLAPDVQTIYEFIDDQLFGDAFTFHFPTNVTRLNANQLRILKETVIPLMTPGAVIGMYGLADRTGSQSVNYSVSGQRLVNFESACRLAGAPLKVLTDPNADYDFFGEDYLESVNSPDDKPSFYGRCVALFIWPNVQSSQRVFADLPFIQYTKTH